MCFLLSECDMQYTELEMMKDIKVNKKMTLLQEPLYPLYQ